MYQPFPTVLQLALVLTINDVGLVYSTTLFPNHALNDVGYLLVFYGSIRPIKQESSIKS